MSGRPDAESGLTDINTGQRAGRGGARHGGSETLPVSRPSDRSRRSTTRGRGCQAARCSGPPLGRCRGNRCCRLQPLTASHCAGSRTQSGSRSQRPPQGFVWRGASAGRRGVNLPVKTRQESSTEQQGSNIDQALARDAASTAENREKASAEPRRPEVVRPIRRRQEPPSEVFEEGFSKTRPDCRNGRADRVPPRGH